MVSEGMKKANHRAIQGERNVEQEIQIVRSNRKSIGLEIKPDLQIVLRVPYRMTDREIQRFLQEKADWIDKYWQRAAAQKAERDNRIPEPKMTTEEIRMLAEQALQVIPAKVRHFAPIVGVNYGRITIRNQRTRWGSCSAKGNLNFNCMLMKTPPEVVDYVVVHELCHRLEMNHSPRFWAQVERVCPQYRQARAWLKKNGAGLIDSMPER